MEITGNYVDGLLDTGANLFFVIWVAFLIWGLNHLRVDLKIPQITSKNVKKRQKTPKTLRELGYARDGC